MKLYLHIEDSYIIYNKQLNYPTYTYIWKGDINTNIYDIVSKCISEYHSNILNDFQSKQSIDEDIKIYSVQINNNNSEKIIKFINIFNKNDIKNSDIDCKLSDLGVDNLDDLFENYNSTYYH